MFYGLVTISFIIYITGAAVAADFIGNRDLRPNPSFPGPRDRDFRPSPSFPGPRDRARCPSIRNSLPNGKVRIRSRGRIAKFACRNGYELVGKPFATCVRGHWNNPVPICVTNGCSTMFSPINGRMDWNISDALASFSCDPGYTLTGSSTVYCDGFHWNDTVPYCLVNSESPKYECDFETPDICGWIQDKYHDFDWIRHQFSTPSGHVGTGPSSDHTLGKDNNGHYMYIEASSPRRTNDMARLFSPVYNGSQTTPGCFVFWYHMYGESIGILRVNIKTGFRVLPAWERKGPQGNLWLQGAIPLPEINYRFQIIIEGIRGSSYVGDIAIDDVSLHPTPCEDLPNVIGGADSCYNRCFTDDDANSSCSCRHECTETLTCCGDFQHFCVDLPATQKEVSIFSIEPSPKDENNQTESSQPSVDESTTLQTTVSHTLLSASSVSNASVTTSGSSDHSSANSSQANSTSVSEIPSSQPTEGLDLVVASQNATIEIENKSSSPSFSIDTITNRIMGNTTQAHSTSVVTDQTTYENLSTNQTIAPVQITVAKGLTSSGMSTSVHPRVSSPKPTPLSKPVVESERPFTPIIPKISVTFPPSTLAYAPNATKQSTSKEMIIPTPMVTGKPSTQSTFSREGTTPNLPTPTRGTTGPTSPKFVTTPKAKSKESKLSTTDITRAPSAIPVAPTRFKSQTLPIPSTSSRQRTTSSGSISSRTTVKFSSDAAKFPRGKPRVTTSVQSVTNITRSTDLIHLNTTVKFSTTVGISKTTTTGTPNISTASTIFKKPTFSGKGRKTTYRPSKKTKTTTRSTAPAVKSTAPSISTSFLNSTTENSTLQDKATFPVDKIKTAVVNSSSSLEYPSSTQSSLTTHKHQAKNKDKNVSLTDRGQAAKLSSIVMTEAPLTTASETDTPTGGTPTKGVQQDTWKPDFKARTKYRTYLQKPSSKPPVSVVMVAVVALGSIAALTLIIVILAFFICRKRRITQSKLSDDSEMRFLSDSEIIEFADPSSKLYSESID